MTQTIEINQSSYELLKRQVSGFYGRFNQGVLRFHMNKIFDYDSLIETPKQFPTFKEYYDYHTYHKQDVIEEHVAQMLAEAIRKNLNPTPELVRNCLIVRLGNIYNGMVMEDKVLVTLQTVADWIFCQKVSTDIDMNYKVDAVVEIPGVDRFAIQIKPISFLSYDKGSEKVHHERYEKEFGTKVFYCFYKGSNTIVLNNVEISMSNTKLLEKTIEKIMLTL